jgi:hypothetical protein
LYATSPRGSIATEAISRTDGRAELAVSNAESLTEGDR